MQYCKLLLFFLFVACALPVSAQGETWKFRVVRTDYEGKPDTILLEIHQASRKYIYVQHWDGETTTITVDSVKKLRLTLVANATEKKAFVRTFRGIDSLARITGYSPKKYKEGNEYRFTPETKTICGLKCQKADLFEYRGQFGTGWIAVGHHIPIGRVDFVWDFPAGQLVAFESLPSEKPFRLELLSYKKDVHFKDDFFNTTAPAGYTLKYD